MMKIQEVDEQELCMQIFYYVEGMSKDCECKAVAVIWWMCLFHVRSFVI